MHVRISSPTLSWRFLDKSISAAAQFAGSSKPTSTTSSDDGTAASLESLLALALTVNEDMKFTSGTRDDGEELNRSHSGRDSTQAAGTTGPNRGDERIVLSKPLR